jgi:hypothetical protein
MNRIKQVAAVLLSLALVLFCVPMADATTVTSGVQSVTATVTTSESISLTVTPGTISIPFAGASGTATGPVSVSYTAQLALTRTLALYQWITNSGSYLAAGNGPGTISYVASSYPSGNGPGTCNSSAASQVGTGASASGGIDGYYCGVGNIVDTPTIVAGNNGNVAGGPYTELFSVGTVNGGSAVTLPYGTSVSFTINYNLVAY